jgi:flavin-dependent dehydrogenase
MPIASFADLDQSMFDVVICGGGLAGLTLARQLRRTHPSLSVLVAEKTARPLPEAAHKVGESSVELGSQYLERLGLREYLRERHLFKHGLRFYPGGGELPLEERTEIGPAQEPIVPSYQLDRGRFENDLRDMITADGVTLVEGTTVGEITLGQGETPHEIALALAERCAGAARPAQKDGEKVLVRARWVVDATGRNALLRRRMKLTRGARHDANAGWFRVEGKVDITSFVPETVREWHDVEWAPHRWRSTNHLMGEGYWAWIIPLASGNTSIGLVVHDAQHGFDCVRTLDRVRAFLEAREPVLARHLAERTVLDFRCLRGYSHNVARGWSADRWAIVGEAGAFVDPLYSPGTDYIAFANSFTEEMIRTDLAGGDLEPRARELNLIYRALINGNLDLYRDAAVTYGHAGAMIAKVYWDNFAYWAYPCQFFLQELYRLTGPALSEVIPLGQRFVDLSNYVQRLLGAWAALAPEPPRPGFHGMPAFPSVLIDAHLALQQSMSAAETLEYMKTRLVEGEEIVGELLIRVLDEVGEARAEALCERADIARWDLRIRDERIEAADAVGLARRKALRPLARDVERTLGKLERRVSQATFRRLLAPLLTKPNATTEYETVS